MKIYISYLSLNFLSGKIYQTFLLFYGADHGTMHSGKRIFSCRGKPVLEVFASSGVAKGGSGERGQPARGVTILG